MNETSVLKLKYRLSLAYRQAQFVATGSMPALSQSVELDMTQATPTERAAILRVLDPAKMELSWDYWKFPEYDGQPQIAQVAADATRLADEAEAAEHSRLAEETAQKIRLIAEAVERKEERLSEYQSLKPADLQRAGALGIDLSTYQAALDDYLTLQPEFQRLARETRARVQQAQEAYAERKRQAEAEAAESKRAWIAAHGSAFLKRACLDGGYDCQRRYVIERAALEAPGFVVDVEDDAVWKSRSCPSEEALDAADAVTRSLGDPLIVWLTSPAHDHKPGEFDDEPFDECEAVVIRGYLGRYDLVKIL